MPSKPQIISEVLEERVRQERLRRDGRIPFTCSDPDRTALEKFCVLGEEVGEVGKAINEEDWENLREELTQVAAVAIAWLESF